MKLTHVSRDFKYGLPVVNDDRYKLRRVPIGTRTDVRTFKADSVSRRLALFESDPNGQKSTNDVNVLIVLCAWMRLFLG